MGIEEKVVELIIYQLGVDKEEVVPEATFIDDLGADSLDIVELIMAFEEEFEIDIPEEDAHQITTVRKAIKYIQENTAA